MPDIKSKMANRIKHYFNLKKKNKKKELNKNIKKTLQWKAAWNIWQDKFNVIIPFGPLIDLTADQLTET